MSSHRIGIVVMLTLLSAVALLGVHAAGTAPQGGANSKTLVERLGYPRDAKLIIVHADDVGVTHSVNAATVTGLNSGLVNSASIMVPCPWFPEIADYAKAHQDVDFG